VERDGGIQAKIVRDAQLKEYVGSSLYSPSPM